MLNIVGDRIEITKGDSADIRVNLSISDTETYEMESGDTLTMTVRPRPGQAVIFSVTSDTNVITLTPVDTKKLSVGQCCYDIELRTASGAVYTVVGVKDPVYLYNMTVYPEITE